MRIVLVCGGRDYRNWEQFQRVMAEIPAYEILRVISGGARGADYMAKRWCAQEGFAFAEFKADWEQFGKQAGYLRNRHMLYEGQADLVIAFPGGRGTANMIELARKKGVEVVEVKRLPQFVGYIRNTKTNSGKGRNGRPWTSYNAEIHTEKGVQKISFGFDKPSVQEGDYVKLEADVVNGFMQVDQSTVQRIDPIPEPKKAGATVPTGTNQTADIVPDYNRQTHPEDAQRITYSAAVARAIEMVSMLMQNNALPVSAASNKAGTAKRFDELMAAVQKISVQFYHDGMTLRLLDTVADTEPSTAPKSDLPDEEPELKGTNPIDD